MGNILYDPDRIEPIIKLLQKQWEEHPMMRLGQLIENITCDTDCALFYIKDDYIKKRLTEYKGF